MLKNLMQINMKKIINNIWVLLAVLYLGSCTSDYLDINDDPNNPTEAVMNQLLPGGEFFMAQALGQGNFIGNNLQTFVHQIVTRETQNYGMTPGDNNIFNSWNYLYTYALPAFDAVIEAGDKDGHLVYAGIGKTLKAYSFSVMVDLWGDIPYSEYNVQGNNAPKPDSSKDIYNSLIALLEEANANFKNPEAISGLIPGKDDFFYGEEKTTAAKIDKWIRLNNTIQLRLLLQSRKAKADITGWKTKLDALMVEDKFMTSGGDLQFWYNTATTPQDMRHPAISQYTGQQTNYISPFFYETMAGITLNTTGNPFSGIKDPRMPYYFVNQLKSGQDSENAHEYRNGNFMSIFFATNGPNSSGSNDKSLTKIGFYPAGGKYDNGEGGAISLLAQYGQAPHKMVTFFSLKFMLAELVLAGETNGDAKVLLKDAINASIAHLNSMIDKQSNAAQKGTPKILAADRDAFVNAVLAKYDAANADGKMRIVMTQKWIANYFNPIDSYTDYRRTGYPVMFDPAKTTDPGNGVNPTVAERSPAEVPLMNIASYPRSLYYPTNSETELNPNMTQKTNLSTPFVFWDK